MGNRTSKARCDAADYQVLPSASTSSESTKRIDQIPSCISFKAKSGALDDDLHDKRDMPPGLYFSYLEVAASTMLTNETKTSLKVEEKEEEEIPNKTSKPGARLERWCGTKYFSDLVLDGLRQLEQNFPPFSTKSIEKELQVVPPPIVPFRYAMLNGSGLPVYVENLPTTTTESLVCHWNTTVPKFQSPTFFNHAQGHSAASSLHFSLHKFQLESICRLIASSASTTEGGCPTLFIDQHTFSCPLADYKPNYSGCYGYYVNLEASTTVQRIRGHFFIKPNDSEQPDEVQVIWFGCSESYAVDQGKENVGKADAFLFQKKQSHLETSLRPNIENIVQHCRQHGYWGFCGVDALRLKDLAGEEVDRPYFAISMTPRVTDTCPAAMVATLMKDRFGFDYGIFRQGSYDHAFPGSAKELLKQVEQYNETERCVDITECQVVIFSLCEHYSVGTMVDIGVYGSSLQKVQDVLNRFAPATHGI